MPRTKRRERHKLNKTKKIYYGGGGRFSKEEEESLKIIKESHNKTIEQNVYENDEIKINEINKIIIINRKCDLTQFWLTEMINGAYFKDKDTVTYNRIDKYLLNEGEKDISYKNINRLLEKKGIGLPKLFTQVGKDIARQNGDYIKVNNGAIIDIMENLSKNENDVKEQYKKYINNYYTNDITPDLNDDKLRGFKVMLYYKKLINEHQALVAKIRSKKLSMDNILLQIIFLTSNQSIHENKSDTLHDILSKNKSVMNLYSQLNPNYSFGKYYTFAESLPNCVEFTITDNELKETKYINDIVMLVNNEVTINDNLPLVPIGYITGTIKIDYINQTYIENISIHIDPRVTYANKLLPPPAIGADAGADTSADTDADTGADTDADAGAIDNKDILDIFYSTNLNKNQNYYIFNMLETMS